MTAEIPASVKPFSIIRPDASECRYSIAATIIYFYSVNRFGEILSLGYNVLKVLI